jgi:tetratricopeptide (TPR) repeat protein
VRPGKKPAHSLYLPLLLVAAFSACGGPSQASKKSLNSLLAAQDFDGAATKLRSLKYAQYGRKNSVLYNLDLGAVLHYAGKYKESDKHLAAAEDRMEELYTKSVSKTLGTLLLNDTTTDYAGEAFERALTNVFRALNYVFLGQPYEAVVEARKAEQFLSELHTLRQNKPVYKDDAFARYLDSLLYADIGKADDARISYEAAQAAYRWYAVYYNTPLPRFPLEKDMKDFGELVVLHYNGLAPIKVSRTFQVAWGQGLAAVEASKGEDEEAARALNAVRGGLLGNQVTVSYPAYEPQPFSITGSEVFAGDQSAPTLIMEDVAAIAMKDLADRLALIKTRAIARATVKFILAKAAEDAVSRKYGKNWGLAAKMLASGAAAATETADTRSWTTIPAQIRMARMRLSPGRHEVRIDFKDRAGKVLSSQIFKDIVIKKNERTYLHSRTAA